MAEKIDLHIHTTVSDGTDGPTELLRLVREAGISVFSVTDHDAVDGCRQIRGALSVGDPRFINGIEFSCRDEGGRYHILGYGYELSGSAVCSLAGKAHAIRMEKAEKRLQALQADYGFTFSGEDKDAFLSLDNPGKPHLGNLMVRYGYAASKDQAIRDVLNHLRVKAPHITPGEAIRAIHESGGCAVLAHPPYGSGRECLKGRQLEERIRYLMEFGLDGVETYYSKYDADLREQMREYAGRYSLLSTAGSDYHGKNKQVSLGDTGLDDAMADKRVTAFLNRVLDRM